MDNQNSGWQNVFIIIFPFFIVVGIFQIIGLVVADFDFESIDSLSSMQILIISVFNLSGTLLALWFVMRIIDKEKFINLGFAVKNRLKDFFSGIGSAVLITSINFFTLLFINEISFQRVVFSIKNIGLLLIGFLFMSIAEEVFFRGYVLRNFMSSFNKYIALVLSSLLFAFIHAFSPHISLLSFFNIFIASIFLGISYIYTKNLWFPVAFHFSWNLSQSLLGFNVSGINTFSFIRISIANNNILNGGNFGLEGSVFSLFLMIISIFVVNQYYRQHKVWRN